MNRFCATLLLATVTLTSCASNETDLSAETRESITELAQELYGEQTEKFGLVCGVTEGPYCVLVGSDLADETDFDVWHEYSSTSKAEVPTELAGEIVSQVGKSIEGRTKQQILFKCETASDETTCSEFSEDG